MQWCKPFEAETAIEREWMVSLSLLEIAKVGWMWQTPSSSDETSWLIIFINYVLNFEIVCVE